MLSARSVIRAAARSTLAANVVRTIPRIVCKFNCCQSLIN